jgi:hypothetical protein
MGITAPSMGDAARFFAGIALRLTQQFLTYQRFFWV